MSQVKLKLKYQGTLRVVKVSESYSFAELQKVSMRERLYASEGNGKTRETQCRKEIAVLRRLGGFRGALE